VLYTLFARYPQHFPAGGDPPVDTPVGHLTERDDDGQSSISGSRTDTSQERPLPGGNGDDPNDVEGSRRSERTAPHILTALGVQMPPVVRPEWADEMEAKILDYVAVHAGGISLTNLQAQCTDEACILLMQASDTIDPFRFGFDQFAEMNGFNGATIQTTPNGRVVVFRR
jgi:hypothetical protein